MTRYVKRLIRMALNRIGYDIVRVTENPTTPDYFFSSHVYQRHNQRRLEHLATLGLDIADAKVLEVGCGIGDHTSFFMDRGATIVSTDAREENLKILRSRYPHIRTRVLNLDDPDPSFNEVFDIVYCYGVLYHLKCPAEAIEFMSRRCQKMLVLETRVSIGDGDSINPFAEDSIYPVASYEGWACQPTRRWVFNQLKRHFPFVYVTITQPYHEEFPLDWTQAPAEQTIMRSVFVASRQQLTNSLLVVEIPMKQVRH